jgi:hypothetical protein
MKRHVPCFVGKAGFEHRTLGTKRSAMTTALQAQYKMVEYKFPHVFSLLSGVSSWQGEFIAGDA